ncbi:MAG: hypothetical protein AB203_03890 [Parcubacteria bacterium C7867-008]|nr:MAG: hypothetical protein AB203_03890 [Parcubacteria bacterium C7867-008]
MKRTTLISASYFLLSAVLISVPSLVFADDSFVPLTSLPGIQDVVGSPTLPAFINNIYKFLIGGAAILAVIEISRAGFSIMNSSDSISANKKAKARISNAIIGLVLVLSPYIVFSIINPKILDISLDFSQLKSGATDGGGGGAGGSSASSTTPVAGCEAYPTPSAIGAEQSCNTGAGYKQIDAKCCRGSAAGAKCCAIPKGTASTTPKI